MESLVILVGTIAKKDIGKTEIRGNNTGIHGHFQLVKIYLQKLRSLTLDKIVIFSALNLEVNTILHFNFTLVCIMNALIVNRTAQIIIDNFNFFL